MDNVYRSLTAYGVLKRKLIDAGITQPPSGRSPDARSQLHTEKRGHDLLNPRARQITDDQYDLLLFINRGDLSLVQGDYPTKHLSKVRRLTEFCLTYDAPVVPD